MTVHVLIPVHNRVDTTLACLNCLNRQDYRDYRVIVVDDGSTDGTSERIKERYPQTEILRGDGNLWWTGAMRIGVEHILKTAGKEDLILALNDDVSFGEDYIKSLVDASISNGRALTGSVSKTPGFAEYVADGGMVRWGMWHTEYTTPKLHDDENMPKVVHGLDFIFGHGLLIPVEAFERIGNFNSKDLPHYGGDTEFSCRARRAGFNLVASTASVLHVNVDEAHTGVHYSNDWYVSFRQAWRMFFSIKSAVEVSHVYKFVELCCPRRYRFTNKVMAVTRCLYYSFGKTLPFALPRLLMKYLIKPFPVPAEELLRHGVDIKGCVHDKLIRKKLFMGREYYTFTVSYETLDALDDRRLAGIYRSSHRPGKKLKWFFHVFF